jgi:hypothetical protein
MTASYLGIGWFDGKRSSHRTIRVDANDVENRRLVARYFRIQDTND